MREVTVTGTVGAPPPTVFAFLLDNRNDERWCPMADRYELVEGEPGVGAVYRYRQRTGATHVTNTIRTTVAEPPTLLAWDHGGRGLPYASTIRLTDLGDGRTRVRHSNRVTLPNALAQAAWFTLAQGVLRVQLRNLDRELRR